MLKKILWITFLISFIGGTAPYATAITINYVSVFRDNIVHETGAFTGVNDKDVMKASVELSGVLYPADYSVRLTSGISGPETTYLASYRDHGGGSYEYVNSSSLEAPGPGWEGFTYTFDLFDVSDPSSILQTETWTIPAGSVTNPIATSSWTSFSGDLLNPTISWEATLATGEGKYKLRIYELNPDGSFNYQAITYSTPQFTTTTWNLDNFNMEYGKSYAIGIQSIINHPSANGTINRSQYYVRYDTALIPVADAGGPVTIEKHQVNGYVIQGTATDPNSDDLEYQWINNCSGEVLLSWTAVGANGEANVTLDPEWFDCAFTLYSFTLTLEIREVDDHASNDSDEMILTIFPPGQNTDVQLTVVIKPKKAGAVTLKPPSFVCSKKCEQSYEEGTEVTLQAYSYGGWEFDCWDYGEDCKYDNPDPITMDNDKKITARFLYSEPGIIYLCKDYGKEIEGSFLIGSEWADRFGCGDFTGEPDADGNIICKGTATVGSGNDLGRCGPNDADLWKDFAYTQDCFNHDLCVRENAKYPEWDWNDGWTPNSPCGPDYESAIRDYRKASDCKLY